MSLWMIIIWIISLIYGWPKSNGWFILMLVFTFLTIDSYIGLNKISDGTKMDKWIVITIYDDFTDSEYIIKEFNSEEEAIVYSKEFVKEELYCVAKIIE
ncbi:hypothetical protein BSK59_14070 [Paenibacillus odorifer]|nr:hypothetical protein BSK59_14070 [Paenibacillus odorifer]